MSESMIQSSAHFSNIDRAFCWIAINHGMARGQMPKSALCPMSARKLEWAKLPSGAVRAQSQLQPHISAFFQTILCPS